MCSRSRSWPWWPIDDWNADELFAAVRTRRAVRGAVAHVVRRRAGHALRPLPLRRIRRAAAAPDVGPRREHASPRGRARSASPSPAAARSPTAVCTACSWPARRRTSPRASASSMKRWSSRPPSARRSSSARRRGASKRSRTTRSSSRPRRDSRARCRSGKPTPRSGRFRSARRSASSCARSARRRKRRRHPAPHHEPRSRRASPPRTSCSTSPIRRKRPARCRTTARSSIERVIDELGDWRVCVLSPFGGKIHAPWAMAVTAKVRNELAIDVESMWSDDGFIVRFPETDTPPSAELVIPDPDEVEQLLLRQLGASSMFAAKFREAAARALLLPRTRIQGRTPMWQQRKRAYDLLQVASRFGSFPIILEAYRESLRDVFDVPALVEIAQAHPPAHDPRAHGRHEQAVAVRGVGAVPLRRELSVRRRCAARGTPRAGAGHRSVAAARAARRAGAARAARSRGARADGARAAAPRRAAQGEERRTRFTICCCASAISPRSEIAARSLIDAARRPCASCSRQRRILEVTIAREKRFIAVEDASRYRDALGTPIPHGVAERYLQPVADPVGDLVLRFARTHGPFTPQRRRASLRPRRRRDHITPWSASSSADGSSKASSAPTGTQREWCETEVLRIVRRRSLAKLRKEAEPVDPPVLARLFTNWQGVTRKRRGLDALLEVIEIAAGLPDGRVDLRERDPRRAHRRLQAVRSRHAQRGRRDRVGGRGAARRARRPDRAVPDGSPAAAASRAPSRPAQDATIAASSTTCERTAPRSSTRSRPPSAASPPSSSTRCGTWCGRARSRTTRSTRCARSRVREGKPRAVPGGGSARGASRRRRRRDAGRSCRRRPRTTRSARTRSRSNSSRATAWSRARRRRWRTSSAASARSIRCCKAMEDAGRIRRGYFVAGLGATQFASAGAIDLLRSLRDEPEKPETVMLAATDPANPYGAIVKWPESTVDAVAQRRRAGDPRERPHGLLRLARRETVLRLSAGGRAAALDRWRARSRRQLASLVHDGTRRALLITEINDEPASRSPLGAVPGRAGIQRRRRWAISCGRLPISAMPEGDTIHRAARTLHAALAGRVVTRFETVFPQLARVDRKRRWPGAPSSAWSPRASTSHRTSPATCICARTCA